MTLNKHDIFNVVSVTRSLQISSNSENSDQSLQSKREIVHNFENINCSIHYSARVNYLIILEVTSHLFNHFIVMVFEFLHNVRNNDSF